MQDEAFEELPAELPEGGEDDELIDGIDPVLLSTVRSMHHLEVDKGAQLLASTFIQEIEGFNAPPGFLAASQEGDGTKPEKKRHPTDEGFDFAIPEPEPAPPQEAAPPADGAPPPDGEPQPEVKVPPVAAPNWTTRTKFEFEHTFGSRPIQRSNLPSSLGDILRNV
jgi:hypothetical protein